MVAIKDLGHLREMIRAGVHRYFVRLSGGLRASKYLWEGGDGEIWVENDVDGSESRLSDTYLNDAIKKGAFYAEQ